MKHVWAFFSALMATVLGGLLILVVQGPISRQLDSNRLKMDIFSGPWVPLPPGRGDVGDAWRRDGVLDLWVDQMLAGEPMHMARIVIHNPGGRSADQIRITTGDFPPQWVLVVHPEGPPTRLDEPQEITLAPLDPGQTANIYIWSYHNLESRYFYSDWGAFSSLGEPVRRFHAAVVDQYRENNPIYAFVDDWMLPTMFFLLFIGVLVMGVVAGSLEQYVKHILGDEDWYLDEKIRFDQDQRKFQPRFRSRP